MQSLHGQPAACPRMTQAKQEQPFFTALVDRRMAPDIAPAVRLFCTEECTEDSTSACSEEKKRVSEGATCDAARLTEAWRGCAAPATSRTAC